MINENNTSVSLRKRAESELKRKLLEMSNAHDKKVHDLSESEILKINQELELQKIELELQNEELKKAINKAETATALYDFSPAGYFTLSREGIIEHLNISAATMLGEDRTMVSQNNIKAYISKDSLPVFEDFLQKTFYTKLKQVCEIKIINHNNPGTEVCLYIEGNVSNKGKCLVTAFDICKQKEAENQIYTLRTVIEQGPSAIVITNPEGKIVFVNNKYTELTQFTAEDVMGKNARIFNKGHLPEHQYIDLWDTLNKGKTWEGKVKNRRKDNTYFWDETSISAVKNHDGSLSNYILIQNDISEKEQIIDDLIQAKEKAEESDILKSAFLANMSHEIRTPLNSIIGFSELIGEEDFDQSQLLHFAQIINSSGNKLLSIISDIMDLSRIEAGEVKVDKRKLSVNQMVSNIHKEYQLKAMEKGLDIKINCTNTNELFTISDENKLRQILINFVGNAIKFTDKGSVEIGIQEIGDLVKIYVKDTGIGIPDQYKDQIFERFRQVESAYSRKYGGNGLGLAISKALIELLGGKVGMETEYGNGSTFYFTLPLFHE